jgi:integrase
MRALGDQGTTLVMKSAKGTRLEPFVVLALATGARKGELLGLRWSDIDLGGGTVGSDW